VSQRSSAWNAGVNLVLPVLAFSLLGTARLARDAPLASLAGAGGLMACGFCLFVAAKASLLRQERWVSFGAAHMTRRHRIVYSVSAFASLDGIVQAPGGPDEDPTGGFTLGGWMAGYGDESMDISASGFDGRDRELVLGRGKRIFSETAKPSALRLVRSQVSTTGVVMSTYVPAGDIRPGSFPSAEPSEKELARRKKMADDMW
jgi:hypothetical protein